MKKILFCVTIFAFLRGINLFAFGSPDTIETVQKDQSEKTEEVVEQKKELTKEEKKALKEKEAEEKKLQKEKEAEEKKLQKEKEAEEKKLQKEKEKEEKKLAEFRKKLKKDDALGITYLPVKNTYTLTKSYKIELKGNPGSFNIYSINDNSEKIPVLSPFDSNSSTFISVLADNYEYRLNRAAGVKSEVREVQDSKHIQLAYTIPNQVQVVVDFVPVATDKNIKPGSEDAIRVMIFTTNISEKTMNIGVKGVFDTIIGENSPIHFRTGSGTNVKREIFFESMRDERWIVASNGNDSAQFVLFGKEVSSPIQVAMANRDILSNSTSWKPSVVSERTFTSSKAYNNSAIAVNWLPVKLESNQTDVISFYIAMATNGNKPNGAVFARTIEEEALENAKNPPPVDIVVSVSKENEAKNDKLTLKPETKSNDIQPSYTSAGSLKEDQLNAAYVQALINRINNLQSDPDLVDRDEVQRLNAELDLIMKKIRQQL